MFGFLRRYLSNAVAGIVEPARALLRHRGLLAMLVRREIAGQTSGTLFGGGWMLLQPALQMVGLWFLIDVVLRVKYPGRVPFLDYFLVGMLPWLMIADVMQRSLTVLQEMAPLYRRTPFPLEILPLVPPLIAGGVYGVVYLGVVLVLGGISGLGGALASIIGLMVWLMPVSYLLAVVGLFLRDVRQFFPFVIVMGLYLTPILYMPQMLPEWAQEAMAFNPFADLMALIHGVVQGMAFERGNWLRPLIYWLLLLTPAWVLYRRSMPHMREAL